MKKIISVILAFVMCFTVLVSCSEKKENVMEIDGGKGISINFIYLLTSINKAMYNEAVTQSSGGNWNEIVYSDTETTWSDLLMDVVLSDAENFLVCEYLFDDVYGLKLSKEDELQMEKDYETYVAASGSEKAFEDILSGYSADKETFNRYIELATKRQKLSVYLYYGENGTNGTRRISEDVIKQTFADEYSIVTHIYFNSVTKELPSGQLMSLTEEEVAEKKALAENVYNMIMAGEDFYTLKEQYTEDVYESAYYPDGFFVTNDNSFPAAFTSAAMEMEEGSYKLVDSGNGIHIMYKLPMNELLYNSNQDVYIRILSRLISLDFNALIEENLDKVKRKGSLKEQVETINVQNIPAFAFATE